MSEERLRDFARERLAGFKVPGLNSDRAGDPERRRRKDQAQRIAAAFSKTQPAAGNAAPDGFASLRIGASAGRIWADILDIDQIGIDQDVFALGVDSLAMTQMILRLEKSFGVSLSLKDIFDAPTVASLALRVKSSKKASAGALARHANRG